MSEQSTTSPDSPKPHLRFRWLFWLLGGLFMFAVVLHFTVPSIVTSVVNQKLPELLNTEVSLGAFQLDLIRGRTGFSDLVIHQPGSSDQTPFLSVKGIRTHVPIITAITANPVVIESLEVDRLELYITTDSEGHYNFIKFKETDSAPETAPSQDDGSGAFPPIWLKNLQATELSLTYLDRQNNQDLIITNFNVTLRNLHIVPNENPLLLPQITLDTIDMDHLSLSLTLRDSTSPETEADPENVQQPDSIADQNTPPAEPFPGLWVKALRATQFEFHMREQVSGLDLLLEDFNLEIDNLLVGEIEKAPRFADLRLNTLLRGVETSSRLQMDGRVGPILPERTPAVQIALSLVGFELETIAPVIKTSAVKALGAGLDLSVMLEIQPGKQLLKQRLGGKWRLLTSSQIKFDNHIEGTLGEPELGLADLTHQLFIGGTLRMTGNVADNIVSGSGDAIETLGDTSMEVVGGVGKTTKGFFGGLWSVLKGTATLDKDEVTEGLEEATTGTISDAGETVVDTTDTASEGVIGTAQSTAGIGKGDLWFDEIESRAMSAREEGLEWLSQRTFPTE